MFIIPQWRNCSVDCERCSSQETHIISTTDKDILSVHTKERLLTGITAPAGAPKSITKTWLMESGPFTAQLPTGHVPPHQIAFHQSVKLPSVWDFVMQSVEIYSLQSTCP